MTDFERVRREERSTAIIVLMLLPDPPDIQGRRRYKYHYGGDKLRQPDLKLTYARAYFQFDLVQKRLALGRDESCVVSVRSYV